MERKGTLCFDMDGTMFDLYGVEGWLDCLENNDPRPYAIAKPMFNFSLFAREIHRVQRLGYAIEIISWLSKSSNTVYDRLVTEAKHGSLNTHLPSVIWDNIYIVPYGTPKSEVTKADYAILFDDEEKNRSSWNKGEAYTPDMIFEILKGLR